jgi:hypothetical protein
VSDRPAGARRSLRAPLPLSLGWLALAWMAPVLAEQTGTPVAPAASCVEVSVNQHAVLAFDCLSQALAGTPALPRPTPVMDGVAQLPSNQQVGQYNYSTLRNRMGSNLGKSVWPQRPPAAAPTLPAVQLAPGH